MLLDIHSHHAAPYPEGIISTDIEFFSPVAGQLYSVGIHPWTTVNAMPEDSFRKLEEAASLPQTAAIGEAGIDPAKGAPLFRQLQIFKRQVELSEKFRKPLIVHAVKSADIILGLKRDFNPTQPWVIHGFRGKPGLALQYVKAGILLSFGEKFNPEALKATPPDMIFAETDESPLDICTIIDSLSAAYGSDLEPVIAENLKRLLSHL